jgi:hypothetical protein
MITDAYSTKMSMKKGEKDKDEDARRAAIYKRVRETYSSLQEAFEAGDKDVLEALSCVHYSAEGKMSMHIAPYARHEKVIVWEQQHDLYDGVDGAKLAGIVPEAIQGIMSEEPLTEKLIQVRDAMGLTPEQAKLHQERAARRLFHEKDYMVIECIPWKPEEGYGVLLERMKQKYDEMGDIYDFKEMKTKPEYLERLGPSDN